MENLFNRLLSFLCLADILFLSLNLLVLPHYFGYKSSIMEVLFPFFEGMCHFSLTVSIFLIVAITIERFQAVCFPHLYKVSYFHILDQVDN